MRVDEEIYRCNPSRDKNVLHETKARAVVGGERSAYDVPCRDVLLRGP